jgi:nitroreductase
LDVDAAKEAAICLASIGAGALPPALLPALAPLKYPTQRLSAVETDYPAIVEMHSASSLPDGAAAAAWRSGSEPAPAQPVVTPSAPIETVITRRGSARQFTRAPIQRDQLQTLLEAGSAPVAWDAGGPLTMPYLIVNAVDGLESGSYAFDPATRTLQQLRTGAFRDAAGFLDLGQALAADAAVDVYSLTDLRGVLEREGDRGYRAAQLEGAIAGGRLYLAAYALGLGATGLTFFDDDVTRFFSPPAADHSVMFLTAIGHPARRA